MTETQLAVVEWAPDRVRAYNPATNQSATGKTVEEALQKVGRPTRVGLCLSRRISFVRESRLPDVDKNQAKMVLQLRINEMFPSVGDGVSFDFVMGEHRYDDGLQTTVVAVPSETLRNAISQIGGAGAKVVWTAPVALGSISVGRAYAPQAYAVIESDGDFLNIDVIRHGSLVFCRSVLDPHEPQARSAEVVRTLAACGITDAIPVSVNGLDLPSASHGSGSDALSAMADHDPATLNVLTPEAAEKISKAGTGAKNRLALHLWLGVVCSAALVWSDRMDASDAITAVTSKEGAARAKAQGAIDVVGKAIASENSKTERIMLGFEPSQPTSEVLTVVSNALPSGAWITGVLFERGKPLQVRGVALRSDVVSDYTSALALDSRFRDVKLVFANNAEIESTAVVQFSVTMHVVGNLPLDDKDIKGSKQ